MENNSENVTFHCRRRSAIRDLLRTLKLKACSVNTEILAGRHTLAAPHETFCVLCVGDSIFFLLRFDLGQNKTRVCCLHSKIAFAAYRYRFAKRESNPATHVVQLTSRESPTITAHQHKTFIYNSPLYTMFFFSISQRVFVATVKLILSPTLTSRNPIPHENLAISCVFDRSRIDQSSKHYFKILSNSLTLPTLNQPNPRLEMFCGHSRTKKLLYLR